jgi:hypothetical protein
MKYHVGRAGHQLGVFTLDELRAQLSSGELKSTDLGWTEGMKEWQPLAQILGGQPADGAATSPTPPTLSAPAMLSYGQAAAEGLPPKPNNFLVPSILVTLFCCLPVGIAAIVYATQVDGKFNSGDYAGAANSAKMAKTLTFVSIGAGLLFILVYVALMIAGIAASGAHAFSNLE